MCKQKQNKTKQELSSEYIILCCRWHSIAPEARDLHGDSHAGAGHRLHMLPTELANATGSSMLYGPS